MNKQKKKLISVIIPCYKQGKEIMRILNNIENSLKGLPEEYDYEIIVVVDGIVDKTYVYAKRSISSRGKVVGYKYNYGKGYALRYGMARSKGAIIAFIDGGTDLNPISLRMLLAHFDWYTADIIVGSKWHAASLVEYPLWRKILSKGYGIYVRLLFNIRIKDTQLGMKIFKREVLEDVLPRLLVKKYAVDIELLSVANRLGYKKIFEAPIEMHWKESESEVSKAIVRVIFDMFIDTLAVFYRLKILKYYDDSSKRKWRYDNDLNFKVNIG